MATVLIRNGTVLTGAGRAAADVLVDGGSVARVEPGLRPQADRIIDAAGKFVMPGGVDAHTHLDMPAGDITSTDDFETGTIAAAHGGTTTIIDFATPEPGESLFSALDAWTAKAEGKAVIDFGFHMVLRDFSARTAAEADWLAAREGVTSFKMFMAYPGRLMAGDGAIGAAMRHMGERGGLVMVHAEDGAVIEALIADALRRGNTALSAATHHMRVDYSLYEGRTVTGAPETVLSRGEIIVDRGAFVGRPGRGRFLARSASGTGFA